MGMPYSIVKEKPAVTVVCFARYAASLTMATDSILVSRVISL